MDDQLKKLMKELGEAINQAVADSDRIADVIGRIRATGNDVFLVLEANIGFTQRDSNINAATNSSGELEITSQDAQFLRSLRISVNNDGK